MWNSPHRVVHVFISLAGRDAGLNGNRLLDYLHDRRWLASCCSVKHRPVKTSGRRGVKVA